MSGANPNERPRAVALGSDVTGISDELTAFLSLHMASFKCSAHDLRHCYRVASLALNIASSGIEKAQYDLRVVYLAGLLHDILDSKLVDALDDTASIEKQATDILLQFESVSDDKVDKIMKIVKNVGYKNLIQPNWLSVVEKLPAEYKCVQDADLLDAIGSVGITRVFSYGGRKNRPVFGFSEADSLGVNQILTPEEYAVRAGGSVEHFFDKLLRIRSLLLTAQGIKMGNVRHFRMVQFLHDVDDELAEAGDPEAGRISELLQDRSVTRTTMETEASPAGLDAV